MAAWPAPSPCSSRAFLLITRCAPHFVDPLFRPTASRLRTTTFVTYKSNTSGRPRKSNERRGGATNNLVGRVGVEHGWATGRGEQRNSRLRTRTSTSQALPDKPLGLDAPFARASRAIVTRRAPRASARHELRRFAAALGAAVCRHLDFPRDVGAHGADTFGGGGRRQLPFINGLPPRRQGGSA